MAELNLEIITPSKTIFNGPVKSVTVPGIDGSFQILRYHAPLISVIDIGLVKVVSTDDVISYYATGGGTVEVNNNKVLLLADSIELAESIDVARAENAKHRAEERLSNRTKTTDVQRAEVALRRAVNRLKIVEQRIRQNV